MQSLWDVLNTHVRLRRMEYGLDPMPKNLYSDIVDALTAPENPLFDFFDVHGSSSTGDNRIGGILDLETMIDICLTMSGELFSRF